MCRPMPPEILPTVILVCASAAEPSEKATAAASAAVCSVLMACPPEPRPSRRLMIGKNYTSLGYGVELGRHVFQVLERRLQQRPRQKLLWVGQRLVRRPLLGGDHVGAAGFEDLVELVLGQLGAERVVGLVPDDPGILVGLYAEVLLEARQRARLVVAVEHHAPGDSADELLHGVR